MTHRLIFFGSGAFGLPALEQLHHLPDGQVVGVVTQPAKPTGRGQPVKPTIIATWAGHHKLSVLAPESLKVPTMVEELQRLQADTFVVAAYGLILPLAVLQVPLYGSINVHASLLPKYRGASPIAAAIVAGERETGISFMLMDEHLDTGPVLRTVVTPISKSDTSEVLQAQLARLAAENLPTVLDDWWAGRIHPTPQSGPSSYAPKVLKSDGYANWQSGKILERKIRAYIPWPVTWTTWQGTNIKILAASFIPGQPSSPQGTIEVPEPNQDWAVACGDGWIIPHQVQFAGKRRQSAATIPGSYPGLIGSRLPS
ncbi:MAG: methionyl-tRNA formyltransferase [Candidatus Kerfeldbacteria bacterium]|nr:methionyl-tRNA formyltransferase [Candidatus Kerfeldbacteria bacterium]